MAKALGDLNEQVIRLGETSWAVEMVSVEVDCDDEDLILRFTSHYHDIDYAGYTYLSVGNYLGFSGIKENIDAKNESLAVSLSGVSGFITSTVLENPVIGALVRIYRGFYDEETGDLVQDPYHLWAGRVGAFSITDDFNSEGDQDAVTVTLDCTSLLGTLLERQSGVYTSLSSFQNVNPGDLSMDFIAGLVDKDFDFGKE